MIEKEHLKARLTEEMSRIDSELDKLDMEDKNQSVFVEKIRYMSGLFNSFASFIEKLTPEEWEYLLQEKGGSIL